MGFGLGVNFGEVAFGFHSRRNQDQLSLRIGDGVGGYGRGYDRGYYNRGGWRGGDGVDFGSDIRGENHYWSHLHEYGIDPRTYQPYDQGYPQGYPVADRSYDNRGYDRGAPRDVDPREIDPRSRRSYQTDMQNVSTAEREYSNILSASAADRPAAISAYYQSLQPLTGSDGRIVLQEGLQTSMDGKTINIQPGRYTPAQFTHMLGQQFGADQPTQQAIDSAAPAPTAVAPQSSTVAPPAPTFQGDGKSFTINAAGALMTTDASPQPVPANQVAHELLSATSIKGADGQEISPGTRVLGYAKFMRQQAAAVAPGSDLDGIASGGNDGQNMAALLAQARANEPDQLTAISAEMNGMIDDTISRLPADKRPDKAAIDAEHARTNAIVNGQGQNQPSQTNTQNQGQDFFTALSGFFHQLMEWLNQLAGEKPGQAHDQPSTPAPTQLGEAQGQPITAHDGYNTNQDVQTILKGLTGRDGQHYYNGAIDGALGRGSHAGILKFQQEHNITPADGHLNQATYDAIATAGQAANIQGLKNAPTAEQTAAVPPPPPTPEQAKAAWITQAKTDLGTSVASASTTAITGAPAPALIAELSQMGFATDTPPHIQDSMKAIEANLGIAQNGNTAQLQAALANHNVVNDLVNSGISGGQASGDIAAQATARATQLNRPAVVAR